ASRQHQILACRKGQSRPPPKPQQFRPTDRTEPRPPSFSPLLPRQIRPHSHASREQADGDQLPKLAPTGLTETGHPDRQHGTTRRRENRPTSKLSRLLAEQSTQPRSVRKSQHRVTLPLQPTNVSDLECIPRHGGAADDDRHHGGPFGMAEEIIL